MLGKTLLSIDWDYFIIEPIRQDHSYRETRQDIQAKWYQEYLVGIENDFNLEDQYEIGEIYKIFLKQVMPILRCNKQNQVILTESHAAAYKEAIEMRAEYLYLFDAHSDLGYGGMAALSYEVNCANWLGKLLKEGYLQGAFIIYSPYTRESPKDFEEIVKRYHIKFLSLKDFLKINPRIDQVHICRSGPWTPPWYDGILYEFVEAFCQPIKDTLGGRREWQPLKLSLADKINYRLGVI